MPYLNLLSLVAGLGLGVISAAATGCAPECPGVTEDAYSECTSRAGLRYTVCGSDNYEFNDGSHYGDAGLASDYCYCGDAQLQCTDGRRASLCNFDPLDGTTALVYDDGSRAALDKGTAACLGFDDCTLETQNCSFNGWYLRCAGGDVRYVASTTQISIDEVDAVFACNPRVERSLPGGHCEDAIADCDVLSDCDASAACRGEGSSCASVVRCADHDDLTSCAADPACKWELY